MRKEAHGFDNYDRKEQSMDRFEIAVQLSRLYGIHETLTDIDYLSNEKFVRTMREWTDEFQGMVDGDILKFFESKIK